LEHTISISLSSNDEVPGVEKIDVVLGKVSEPPRITSVTSFKDLTNAGNSSLILCEKVN